jgi:hypothetical protein
MDFVNFAFGELLEVVPITRPPSLPRALEDESLGSTRIALADRNPGLSTAN